ncbi:MAG: transporter substrate-binding domain-containing protein [Cyclobacteriaceae bacterium]|nr:transporter substrate-binding domain-containing protein [Cyclobacteriaceae bacterium]
MARPVSRSLALLLILLLHSCTWKSGTEAFTTSPEVSMDLRQIRERGFLQAIVDNNSISYFIYRGQPMGYEYELLQSLAKSLDVELKIRVISGIEQAIDLLNRGEGDLIAFPLTVTKERTEYLAFTDTQFTTCQVLVQRKPTNWRRMPPARIERTMIRNPVDLIGKKVYVMKESSFKERLRNLSQEVGGEIIVEEDSATAETESLIEQVANGEIQLTVTDQTLGMVNSIYYPDLDVQTVLSLPQQIAWAVRQNSPDLHTAVNLWLSQLKESGRFRLIYDKYFNNPRSSQKRISSTYSTLGGNKLSPYDEEMKREAKSIGWDWRLLASVVYQESNFRPAAQSWAGAVGLMQLMPATAVEFGAIDRTNPHQSLKAGVRYLKYLDKLWGKYVKDKNERIKFVLASYNAGLSHVLDARNLTIKYHKNPAKWDEVESFLKEKSNPKYYRDPVAVAGYCKCEEPVNYVRDILARYEEYKILIAEA